MPRKDPEARRAWTQRWKKQGKDIGYNKWLYERRKLRFDDAEEFRATLVFLADGAFGDASTVAKAALDVSKKRYAKVGPSPRHGNGPVKAETEVETHDLLQALAKIGLSEPIHF